MLLKELLKLTEVKLDDGDLKDIKRAGDLAAQKAKDRGDGPKVQERARERAEASRRDQLMTKTVTTFKKQAKKDADEEDRAKKKSKT